MNEYDSQRLRDLLESSQDSVRWVSTDQAEEADLLLLNTCSIREKAQEKVFSQLGRWRQLKSLRPDIQIGVGGCVATQEGSELLKRAPFVDLVFGPQTLHRVPDLLQKRQTKRLPVVDVSFPAIEKFDALPEPTIRGHKAFLSIMEGCSKYCSFCVVPYTRGEEVSRPLDDVLTEAAHAVRHGVRELTLLGQNVNAYKGKDHRGQTIPFAELLHYLAAIPGLSWIRYTTSHPNEVTPQLIEAYRYIPQLVSHLHLPVQSGSDRILSRMKRLHSRSAYIDTVMALKEIRADLHLSSDFIVGFPGESDLDFQHTMDLIDEVSMDFSYSFIYSPRPGTPAADYEDNVPVAVKKERLAILQGRLAESARMKTEAMVGTVQQIMIEGVSDRLDQGLVGQAFNTRLVHVPTQDVPQPGAIISVKINEAVSTNALRGTLLSFSKSQMMPVESHRIDEQIMPNSSIQA